MVQLQEFTLIDLHDSGNKTQLFRSDLLFPCRLESQRHTGNLSHCLRGSDNRSCCFHVESLKCESSCDGLRVEW